MKHQLGREPRNDIKSRRFFQFKFGLLVELHWNISAQAWKAEAYDTRGVTDSHQALVNGKPIGSSFDISRSHATRKQAIRLLRIAMAEKKDPRLRTVREKLDPSAAERRRVEKMMRLGTDYGAGAQKICDMLDSGMIGGREALEMLKKFQETFPKATSK